MHRKSVFDFRWTCLSLAICLGAISDAAAQPRPTDSSAAMLGNPEFLVPPEPIQLDNMGPLPPLPGFSLVEIEQAALNNSPIVAESLARLDAARWRRLQVGLRKNPTLGYIGSEIGDDGKAGQQGAYLGQTVIRGNKRGLNRAVVTGEIDRLGLELSANRLRVLTDVRISFYNLLVLQEREKILLQLDRIADKTTATERSLFHAQESPKTDYLQARIEQDRVVLERQATAASKLAAWHQLLARVGIDGFPDLNHTPPKLVGTLKPAKRLMSWDDALTQVLAEHPSIAAGIAQVDRARAKVRRARAEPISDLKTQFAVQYDNATGNTFASINAGFAVPVWDRNQGGIGAACAEVRQAQAHVRHIEQRLRERLGVVYAQYQVAHTQILRFQNTILPQAHETQELVAEGYRQGDLRFLDFLTAQRTYYQSNLKYLEALQEYWTSSHRLNGLLLDGSLTKAL